ncbi:MAG: 4-hydroxy-tetrahydrodipicolinate reductase [Rhodospirillaceae bacterium]
MKIGVVGCAGRMGRNVIWQVAAAKGAGAELAAASDRPGYPGFGQDAGVLAGLEPLGVLVSEATAAVFAASRVVIDFTTPEATARHAALAVEHRTALVIGTTGLSPALEAALEEASRHIAIVAAPNMSLGVNLLLGLVERVARALDESFDIEVLEMHHRHKVDAPSGTALALGRAAARGRGVALDERAVRSRDGITGPRRAGDIGFATLRGGSVVGDHTVIFAADDERIELSHKAGDRAIFARGAVRAALWCRDRAPGLYGMADVLGL